MTEVLFRLFKHAADAFLFRDVVVQLVNVFLGLFRALMFELSASALSFFGVTCGSFNFAHVTVVAEVDDDDNRNADQKRPHASGAQTAHDKTSACRTSEITNRNPEEVAAPHAPDRLVGFERSDNGSET